MDSEQQKNPVHLDWVNAQRASRPAVPPPRPRALKSFYSFGSDLELMIRLEWTTPGHWKELHAIAVSNMPLLSGMDFSEFVAVHFYRQGWTVFSGERIIGSIGLSDYNGLSVSLHLTIDRGFHKQWASLEMLEVIEEFISGTLKVPKITAFTIVGETDHLGRQLEKLGFEWEGTLRSAFGRNGKLFDLKTYGLIVKDGPGRLQRHSARQA